MLVNTVDRGGNLLLNVGPDAQGVIPETHIARLKEVGDWLQKYGESIYGTRPGPFEPKDDVYGTVQKNNLIYAHLLAVGDTLQLPATGRKIVSCRQMHGSQLPFTQNENGIVIQLAQVKPDANVTTLVLETEKEN